MFEGQNYMLVGSEKASGAPPRGHRHTGIHIPYSPWLTPAAGPPGCDAHAPPVCAVSIPVLVCVPELLATSWGPQ